MATAVEKRLFILTNATHYINIKNYIASHNEAENFVVLAVRPYQGFRDLQNEIEGDPNLKLLQVILIGKERSNRLLEYKDIFSRIYKVKKLKKRLKDVDKVLFTNYNSWLHHYFAGEFNKAQPILVSDGTAIFSVAEKRKKDKEIPFAGSNFFKNKILNLKPIEHLHFYCQVKMDIADSDSQEIFQFEASEGAGINENKIFFVGSPLVEAGYLTMEKNLEYLRKVKAKFAGKEILYFAHRREKAENLNKYSFFGKVIIDSLPFEERMKKETELPGYVVSLVSSILINLPQVLPQVIFYYHRLDQDDIIDKEYGKRYLELIEAFRKSSRPNLRETK